MDRADFLDHARALVCEEREATHGPVDKTFANMAARFSLVLGIDVTPYEAARLMIEVKLARADCGAFNMDDLVDVAGYAAICGELGWAADRDAAFAARDFGAACRGVAEGMAKISEGVAVAADAAAEVRGVRLDFNGVDQTARDDALRAAVRQALAEKRNIPIDTVADAFGVSPAQVRDIVHDIVLRDRADQSGDGEEVLP